MSDKLSETAIARALAKEVCQRLTRKMIAFFQKLDEPLLSGDDSGLKNTWDEICVQVQFEHSFYWDAYEQTIRQLAIAEVEALPTYEREAIWLQTSEAIDWECKDEDEREPYPVWNEDIVEYLLNEHFYHEAGKWSNPRIREYIDRLCSSD